MGFGGSAAAMNVVMKNNRNLLKKRKSLKNTLGSYSNCEKPEFDLPEATPQVLSAIRERLKRENNTIRKRRIILFLAIMSFVLTVFVTLIFN